MPLGTLDRTPPPFFKQGTSALTKLMVFSALALFLMVADARFKLMQPLRATIATALYPLQWVAMGPVRLVQGGGGYFESLSKAQAEADQAEHKLALQSVRASQVEQLTQENQRLRQLLSLREQLAVKSQAAEVLYDTADAYTRKVIIDKGATQGVEAGSPVMDESGVLGQVTRVFPVLSEVTLLIDKDQAIPVINARTGVRGVAYGYSDATSSGLLELRFMAGNSDVQVGDMLTTSGADGVYPGGLRVATVERVDRRADSGFARIYCKPMGQMSGVRHVVVLQPTAVNMPGSASEANAPAKPASAPASSAKGAKK
jgi:rod shape-determining protein MreC